METMLPGTTVGFKRPPESRQDRDVAVRLECLRLATASDQAMTIDEAVGVADALFDYVTDAPQTPDLFAVRRVDEPERHETLGALDYIDIGGTYVRWGSEPFAYRFRSKSEAEAFIASHAQLPGVMQVVPFLPGTPLWGPIYSFAG